MFEKLPDRYRSNFEVTYKEKNQYSPARVEFTQGSKYLEFYFDNMFEYSLDCKNAEKLKDILNEITIFDTSIYPKPMQGEFDATDQTR